MTLRRKRGGGARWGTIRRRAPPVRAWTLAFMCLLGSSGWLHAQAGDAETSAPPPAPALIDTQVSIEEFSHRLVPLTRDELDPLARAWLEIVRSATEEIAERQIALIRDPSRANEASFAAISGLIDARTELFVRYGMVIDALQSKGGEEAFISELRAYRNAVVFEEAILASPRAIAMAFLSWLTRLDGGLAVALDLGVIVAAFLALLILSRTVRGLTARWIARVPNISKLLQAFAVAAIYWVVLVIGLVFVLAAIGVNVTPLFAMIGGASFILAFAFQDTLGNLASGLMIMVNRPFDEGDYVQVAGVGGTVQSVSIVATTVITPDNQVIVIPNKNVWGNVITNVTASETRRIDLVFGISYDDSIEDAERVIIQIVRSHPRVLQEPAPMIRVHELGASSVNFICRPWARTSDYWDVYWDLTHQMKTALENAGLSIPYPQQDVHIRRKGA